MSEEDEEAKAFRPTGRAKPVMVAVAANVALSVVLVGWPYLRGRTRARESVTALREFSSCLLGAAPVVEAETDLVGLAIPRGERERFASLYLHSELSWPASCGAALDAMEHEPAIFLMPAVKTGEAEIHEAANAMRASLAALTDARLHTRGGVPERPLQDFAVLRAAVTSMLVANGLEADPEHPMIRFDAPLDIAEPSRVPTRTAAGWWHLSSNDEVRIVAADSRAVAELYVRQGRDGAPANVRLVQLRRPQSARGVVVAADATWLTWTTSESACDEARHCALRSTGLGRLRDDASTLATEWWLSGHPFERAERSVFIDAARVVILARTVEEGAALRVFDRAQLTGADLPEAEAEERPRAPAHVVALPTMRDFALADDALFAIESREGQALLTRTPYDASARTETPLPLATTQWLLTCGAHQLMGDARTTLLASEGALQRFETSTSAPFHAASRDEDTVRMVCDAAQVAWGSLADGQLVMHRCRASACETIAWPIAGVTTFDLALHEGALWALASHEGSREVLVMQASEHGAPRAPAACWDSGHGFCGPARFGGGAGRLVIGARDESDVMLLMLGEHGFEGIPGLVPRHSADDVFTQRPSGRWTQASDRRAPSSVARARR